MESVIFCHTKSCPQCKAIEMLIKKYQIQNISSCEDVEEMKKLGVTHTPALVIDGKVLQGKAVFDWVNSHKNK